MRNLSAAVCTLFLLAACSHSGPTGPQYPPLAGTYNVTFGGTITPAGYNPQDITAANGTITLNAPDGTGAFSGSYIEGGNAGTIQGTEDQDGGLIISQFGNPNVTPLEDLELLQLQFPFCAFASATTTGLTGTVASGTLNIQGALVMPCNWEVNPGPPPVDQILTTTMTVTITGARQ
jgi:hypothetical protein